MFEAFERNSAAPTTGNGLAPHRLEQIASDHQRGAMPDKLPSEKWTPGKNGLPQVSMGTFFPGPVITDCSKEQCVVNKKQYVHSTDVPGNHPNPLLHNNGKPVIGPDGQPILGPDGVDLEKLDRDILAHRNLGTVAETMFNFRHDGAWDFQRMPTDSNRSMFTRQYANFSNVAIGYIMGSLGKNLNDVAGPANFYCRFTCTLKEKHSDQFPYLAERQVQDYKIGLALYQERHPNGR